jgi:plastocyanin domain-containing protein
MKHSRLFAGAVILTLFLASFAWSEIKEVTAKIDPDGVERVEIVGGGYYFDPNRVVVKVNVPVELKVRKEPGMTPHNIVLKAPEAGIDISEELGGDVTTITFTPTKVGEYPFYCDKKLPFVKSHRERGMEGMLIVTP